MFRANRTTPKESSQARWKVNRKGCWIWQRSGTKNGYGTAMLLGKKHYVHVLLYRLKYGPIPAFMELDHTCRNRRCVNPDHSEPVTHAENLRRGVRTILTMRDIMNIKRKFKRGSGPGKRDGNAKQLAERYGVSRCHIFNIIENRKWR